MLYKTPNISKQDCDRLGYDGHKILPKKHLVYSSW